MKKTIAILMIFVCVLCLGTVYGATNEIISNKTKSELVEIKSKELKSLLYNPGYTPGPIGNPITYQHIIIINHINPIPKKYGSTAL